MAPYLPRDGHTGSPYSEGGAMYALGLITANHGASIQPFLTEGLRSSSNHIIQHGACLGLGEQGFLQERGATLLKLVMQHYHHME
jgi:26S proteasome regulatory subunit N2